jgi:predicted DCC family thiol-disulfide oxidoreductase YuxK
MPASPSPAWPARLVLYDGSCGLCDRTVQWLLRIDRRGRLSFAPLQGTTAGGVFAHHRREATLESIVFVPRPEGDPAESSPAATPLLVRSRAILAILRALGGPWSLVAALGGLLPAALLDVLYDAVARRRYRWFGRRDACRLPAPGERSRFWP